MKNKTASKPNTKNKGPDSKEWPATKVEMRKVSKLIPYANNARLHSEEQVGQIADSIREWGWTVPVLVDEDGMIIAGHGRILAAQKLGIEEVPAMVAKGWTEAQKKAYVIADNQLTLNAEWDEQLLRIELQELQDQDFDIEITGLSSEDIDRVLEGAYDEANEPSTMHRLEAPIYEPEGDAPSIGEMLDRGKAEEIERRIHATAGIPDDIKSFLLAAATRHYAFRYDRIATYYTHASEEVQRLMEESALVIIDYDSAVEHGYVEMNKELLAIREKEEAEHHGEA